MTITETDVKNSRGEIIISPGLKVRHKESQFEYTVDGVVKDDSGTINVVLRLPDEPRFDSDAQSDDVIHSRAKSDSNLIYEIDPVNLYYEPSPEDSDEDDIEMISVPQKEFESEYEVK